MIGVAIIFKFIFRQLSIDDVIRRVGDKLGLKGRAIVCPYPEIGMDVDKPHQLEIMRADLARKGRRVASSAKTAAAKSKTKPRKAAVASKKAVKTKTRPAKKALRRARS